MKGKTNIKSNTNLKKGNNKKINKITKKNENNKISDDDGKLNIIEYNSELKTKKKEFINKIDPHNLKRLIQKERYVWLGVHNELLINLIFLYSKYHCKIYFFN